MSTWRSEWQMSCLVVGAVQATVSWPVQGEQTAGMTITRNAEPAVAAGPRAVGCMHGPLRQQHQQRLAQARPFRLADD
jgi:hypothetical protein